MKPAPLWKMAARHCPMAHGLCLRLKPQIFARHFAPANTFRAARAHPPRKTGKRQAYSTARSPRSVFHPENLSIEYFPRELFHRIVAQNSDTFHRLSADEYYDCAERFSEAVAQGASPMSVSFDRGRDVPAEILHDLGCIMRHTSRRAAGPWSMAMWASASELGYVPSTLSLAQNLIMSGYYLALAQLGKAEARFQQLVARGRDPNALTVEGQWLFKQGRFEAAAVMFQRALKTGSSGFEWTLSCRLWLGRTLLKLGRTEEAAEVFKPLAEAGYNEADIELAKLLRTTDPDRAQQHMYVAGCRGSPEMFTFLSEMALEEALATQATNKRSSKENRRWAVEWSRLADWRSKH